MDYGMIGKIEKAKRYAEERERFSFDNGVFHCDCEFFMMRQRCSHTMALEHLLDKMLTLPAQA